MKGRTVGADEGDEASLAEGCLAREIRKYNEVRLFPALRNLRHKGATDWAACVL